MATVDDLREIALSLPGVLEVTDGHTGTVAWRVKSGMFTGLRGPRATDLRQLDELGRSWPDGVVIGVRTGSLEEKEALLAAEPDVLFTIPHYDGYPGLLVRLDLIDRDRLVELVTDSWLTRAPVTVGKQWLAEHGLE